MSKSKTEWDLFDLARKEIVATRQAQPVVEVEEVKLGERPPVVNDRFVSAFNNTISKTENYEVEISLGTFSGNSFSPGLSSSEFIRLLNFFSSNTAFKIKKQKSVEKRYMNNVRETIVRGQSTFDKKTRFGEYQINSKDWGWRMNVSKEEPIKKPKQLILSVIRKKERWTFTSNNPNNLYHGTKVELTRVAQIFKSQTKYMFEVEVEFVAPKSVEQFSRIVLDLRKGTMMKPSDQMLMSEYEKSVIMGNYNSHFLKEYKNSELYKLENKPRNLNPQLVLDGVDYYITPKFDGVRKFLFFDSNGVFALDIGSNVVEKIAEAEQGYVGTILDTEYMENTNKYYPFDALVFHSNNLTKETFAKRKEAFQKIQAWFIDQKPFFREATFFKSVKKVFDWMETHPEFNYDGFIAQPNNYGYQNDKTGKWKPLEQLTVDFRVKFVKDEKYELYVGRGHGEIEFRGSHDYPLLETKRPRSEFGGAEVSNGDIVEMTFDSENQRFRLYRIRDDKMKPNYESTAKSVWNNIHRPITKDDLTDKTLYFFRKWSNRVKQNLVEQYVPKSSTILDIGIGRGGDLSKWNEPQRIYGVDPDTDNLDELRFRVAKMPTEQRKKVDEILRVAKGKAQETDRIMQFLDGDVPNIVSMFFSMTFLFENEAVFNQMVDTLQQTLPKGGKFIGTVMDGERMFNLLKQDKPPPGESAMVETDSYGFYQVGKDLFERGVFGKEIEITLFDPSSMVKDQREYLVMHDALVDRLEDAGFRLIETFTFDEGSEVLPPDNFEFAKLNRAFVFERITENENVNVEEVVVEEQPEEEEPSDVVPKVEQQAAFVPVIKKHNQPLQMIGDTKRITIQNQEFLRNGVKQGNNSFFHSIYLLLSKKYQELFDAGQNDETEKMVCQKREKIKFSRRDFSGLMDGNVEHNEAYELLHTDGIDTPEQAKEQAYVNYVEKVKNCNEWVGGEIAGYYSDALKINIYVIDADTHEVMQVASSDEAKHSIAVLEFQNLTYEPLVLIENGKRLKKFSNDVLSFD